MIGSISGARWALPVAGALIVLGACTFERRSELEENGEEARTAPGLLGDPPGMERALPPEGIVRLFRDAVVRGDLSLALSLLHREATLVDKLAASPDGRRTRGEILVELRRRHAEGMALEVLESTVHEVEGGTLVLTRLAVLEEEENGIGVEVGRVYETALLVPTDAGWRIRHFHRSLTPSP